MKKKSIFKAGFATLCVLSILLFHYFCVDFDAHGVFKRTCYSVVEIKSSDTINNRYYESNGSGVMIGKDGTIITNYHVLAPTIENEKMLLKDIQVRFINENVFYDVSLTKVDINLDLALLKINGQKSYSFIPFSSKKYSYGDKVYAVGNSMNCGIGISEGIISVPELFITYENKTSVVIQCEINISNGNSGGALLDGRGKLLGVTTFRTKDDSNNINYGYVYSVPVRIIQSFLD